MPLTVHVISIKGSMQAEQMLIWVGKHGTGTGRNLGKCCFSLHTKPHNILHLSHLVHILPQSKTCLHCKLGEHRENKLPLPRKQCWCILTLNWTGWSEAACHYRLPRQQQSASQETTRSWDLGEVQANAACSLDPELIHKGHWNFN